MQKVDIAIGIVGFLALTATALGVIFADEIAGAEEFEFTTSQASLGSQSSNSPDADYEFTLPANATAASFEVTVNEAGSSPLVTGSVTVQWTISGPEGIPEVSGTESFESGDGPFTFEIESLNWFPLPEDGTYSEDELEALTKNWDEPVVVSLVIEGPSSPIPLAPSPTYSASVEGTVTVYSVLDGDLPDAAEANVAREE